MTEGRLTVAVRYCGGCNPRYDRVAFVKELAEACPFAAFVPAGAEPDADLALVVCGCSARCAEASDLTGRFGLQTVSAQEELPSVKTILEHIARKEYPHGLE